MSHEDPNPNQYPLGEPSVLDYLKSLLRLGNGKHIQSPFAGTIEDRPPALTDTPVLQTMAEVQTEPFLVETTSAELQPVPAESEAKPVGPFPWRSLLALGLALIGQYTFEPPHGTMELGFAIYIAAFALLGWAVSRGEWPLAAHAPTAESADPLRYRGLLMIISLGLGFAAFIFFKDNLFTKLNVTLWVLSIVCFIGSLWLTSRDLRSAGSQIRSLFGRDSWTIGISRWTLLLVAATALVLFFRFTQTTSVPPEPFSDHAEKIFDVYDVSQGQASIFFRRNTGREAFQMYWTLLIAKLFGTGLSFLSLKLGTAILGLLTLPFIYLLGKEIGGARVGLLAFLLAGIAYWPNVISRVGLRFPLYPLFVAPTLLYLLRGLRTRNRNDFLLSGLFLGIGLHGYSPMRIVPVVVVVGFLLYWFHSQSRGAHRDLPAWLVMLALTSMFVFMPLLRYWFDDPGMFGFRAFTRMGSVEQPLPGPAAQIFLSNFWNALKMFNYDDGEIWVHSVTHRPALDVISAALFLIGVVLLLVRYIRQRHWLDLFLLVTIPLLLMPSILSLAFPAENPALNRAGGAYVVVFVIVALALEGLLTSFGRGGARSVLMWSCAGLLLLFSASQNYDLVFNQYYNSFRQGAWNSSDMGRVIQEFEQTYDTTETIWIVPFPHWVDTRLPAVWAGIPNRDLAVWRENLPGTVEFTGPKLFLVKADPERPEGNDQESLNVLESLYPNGQLRMFDSGVPGHDFWIFTVPNN